MIITAPKDGKRRPSFRGALVFKTWKGKVVAQAWPKPRGPAKTPGEAYRQEWFRQANILAKYAPARQQALSRCAMNHLPVRPYDALISAMAGRLWAIETDDNRTLYSMASRSDVSKNLDVLAQQPGGIMCRGEAFWEGALPTAEGQLYTSGPAGECGSFKDIPGGAIPSAMLRKTALQWFNPGVFTTITWGEAEFEDWTSWDPAYPDRLYLKPGTTRFVASLNLQLSGPSAGGTLYVRIRNPAGYIAQTNALVPDSPAINLFSPVTYRAAGSWINAEINPPVSLASGAGTGTGLGILTVNA